MNWDASYFSELQQNYKYVLYWLLKREVQALEMLDKLSKNAKIRKEEAIKTQEFELALFYQRLETQYNNNHLNK